MTIDKSNLTNFQRIFHNEHDLAKLVAQVATGNLTVPSHQETPSSVFEAIHALEPNDRTSKHLGIGSVICNPLLLARHEQNQSNADHLDQLSDRASTVSTAAGSNASMHIKDIFNDGNDHVSSEARSLRLLIRSKFLRRSVYLSTDFFALVWQKNQGDRCLELGQILLLFEWHPLIADLSV